MILSKEQKQTCLWVAAVATCALAGGVPLWLSGGHFGPNSEDAGLRPASANVRVITCDLGVLLPQTRITRLVEIANTTNQVLSIARVSSDCDCLVHEVTPKAAPPGAGFRLQFAYNAPVQSGSLRRQVVISFNEADAAPVLVLVQGIVRDWAAPSPRELDFGNVVSGRSARRRLEVTTTARHRFRGEGIGEEMPGLKVLAVESSDVLLPGDSAKGSLYRFDVSFTPSTGMKPGLVAGDIIFRGGSQDKPLKIPCRARVVSPLCASPEQVFFGFTSPGKLLKSLLKVHSNEPNLQLEPRTVKVSHDLGHEFSVAVLPASSAREIVLQCSFCPSARAGSRQGTIKLACSSNITLDVPVRAWVK